MLSCQGTAKKLCDCNEGKMGKEEVRSKRQYDDVELFFTLKDFGFNIVWE